MHCLRDASFYLSIRTRQVPTKFKFLYGRKMGEANHDARFHEGRSAMDCPYLCCKIEKAIKK